MNTEKKTSATYLKTSIMYKGILYSSLLLLACGLFFLLTPPLALFNHFNFVDLQNYLGAGLTTLSFVTLVYLSFQKKFLNQREQTPQFGIENLAVPALLASSDGTILKANNCFNSLFDFDLGIANRFFDCLEQFDQKKTLEDLSIQVPQAVIAHTAHDEMVPYVLSVEALNDCYLILFHPQETTTKDLPLLSNSPFLRALKAQYLFNKAPAANLILDETGAFQAGNDNFFKNFLQNEDNHLGTLVETYLTPQTKDIFCEALKEAQEKETQQSVAEVEFKSGAQAYAYVSALSFQDKYTQTSYKGFYVQFFDNSAQKMIQTRLVHTQKLQALGQLAGGIAHDFNNLLTAIIGFCDLLLVRISPGDQSFTDIMQIKQNANRATNLVGQLLAFSRQQTLQPTVLDVSETLSDLSLLLQRLIGSNIILDIIHDRDVKYIKVDRGQFEQVIVNLVVNAKDALQDEGKITIKTALATYSKNKTLGHETVPAGEYVKITISDNGVGIDQEHLQHIFDPFFSTKALGEGAGLGLSTAYGIIKQTGGYIAAESTVGLGAKFTILIPHQSQLQGNISKTTSQQPTTPDMHFEDLTGQASLLLAEDEDAVRLFAARALTDKGYSVQQAQNGLEALEHLKSLKESGTEPPQILISDVVMPKMDGPTLVREAKILFPELKVLFISGYAEDAFRERVSMDEEIQFLAKPFSLKVLARRIRAILGNTYIKETSPQQNDPTQKEMPQELLEASTQYQDYNASYSYGHEEENNTNDQQPHSKLHHNKSQLRT